jgi:hypothetical protein
MGLCGTDVHNSTGGTGEDLRPIRFYRSLICLLLPLVHNVNPKLYRNQGSYRFSAQTDMKKESPASRNLFRSAMGDDSGESPSALSASCWS